MKTILIDLNIILDYLFNRKGHEQAGEIIAACVLGKAKGCICAHEITTLSYFLSKSVKDKNEIIKTISSLMMSFDIIEVNKSILEKALISDITDYEDAVVVESARVRNVDYIITRNMADFKHSPVKPLTPEEYLATN
ncbi:MAG: twitching motility protein PilT [Treponematales bacterium]